MALVTKPTIGTAKAVQEARHLALPVIALGVIVALLYFGRALFITILSAVTIAFILEPFVELLMRIRFPRSLASFVVCTVALSFLYVIGMGAYSQLAALYGDLPKYGQRIGDIVDGISQRVKGAEDRTGRSVIWSASDWNSSASPGPRFSASRTGLRMTMRPALSTVTMVLKYHPYFGLTT